MARSRDCRLGIAGPVGVLAPPDAGLDSGTVVGTGSGPCWPCPVRPVLEAVNGLQLR